MESTYVIQYLGPSAILETPGGFRLERAGPAVEVPEADYDAIAADPTPLQFEVVKRSHRKEAPEPEVQVGPVVSERLTALLLAGMHQDPPRRAAPAAEPLPPAPPSPEPVFATVTPVRDEVTPAEAGIVQEQEGERVETAPPDEPATEPAVPPSHEEEMD